MRKTLAIILALGLTLSTGSAQQYGWEVRALLGNKFTNLSALAFADSLHGWTARYGSLIYRTDDGGVHWTGVGGVPMIIGDFAVVDSLVCWCVGDDGSSSRLLRTTDGGRYWQFMKDTKDVYYLTVAPLSPACTIVAGYWDPGAGYRAHAVWARSDDSCRSWQELAPLHIDPYRYNQLDFVDSLHGWLLAVDSVIIWGTADGGRHWAARTPPVSVWLIDRMDFIDSLHGWAVSTRHTYYTNDAGRHWETRTTINEGADFKPSAVSFLDTLQGWVFGRQFYKGGSYGAIYATSDGGRSWQCESVGQMGPILDGVMVDKAHGWAVGEGGVVLGRVRLSDVSPPDPPPKPEAPEDFSLQGNYPNPFNSSTTIGYALAEACEVTLSVHDATGRLVRTLVTGAQSPGRYQVRFEAQGLASGTYYCTLKAGAFTRTQAMTLLK